MGEKSYVTYEDVVRFYKDKEEWPYYTEQFIKEGYGQKKGSYLNVAKVFLQKTLKRDDNDLNGNEKSDDERFYLYLMEKDEEKNGYEGLETFKYFGSNEEKEALIVNPKPVSVCKNLGSGKKIEKTIYPSQKWHFYVSYIAYREAAAKMDPPPENVTPLKCFDRRFTYWNGVGRSKPQCPELMLWLAETALGSECSKVQSAYEIARTSRKNGINGKDTCDKIREIIPWSCIEEKIKEKTRI